MLYPSPAHFSWSVNCKLSTRRLLVWNGVWLRLTIKLTMPGTGLRSSYCIQNNPIPKADILDVSSACIHASDQKIFSDLSLGSFLEEIASSFLLQRLPPGPVCICQDRNMQANFFFSFLTTALLAVYIMYCIYGFILSLKGKKSQLMFQLSAINTISNPSTDLRKLN